jgi:metal-dependent amidase/aminoacylase/carboxypeptidase family protein
VSLGTIHGGTRYNIIPDKVDMEGAIRAYDPGIRDSTHEKVRRSVEHIALSAGATSEVTILKRYDVTVNDTNLTQRAVPTLEWAAHGDVVSAPLGGGAEDFSFMASEVPGFFLFLGASTPGSDLAQAAPNHSPSFSVDESTLIVGVRALAALAVDFSRAP